MLCGFQKNKFSKLTVDGINVFDKDDLSSWQNSIGYVPQNIVIFNQSLRENILFGSDGKVFNDVILKFSQESRFRKIFKKIKKWTFPNFKTRWTKYIRRRETKNRYCQSFD